jgi:multicomponent Na+:H+ antiporter subunit D
MNLLPALPILVPLVGALIAVLFRKAVSFQKGIGVATAALMCVVGGIVLVSVAATSVPLVLHVGGWQAPYGITLVADKFAALMLFFGALLSLMVSIYACADIDHERFRFGFVPLSLIMMMGVNGAFLAGDIFNLYVWFEVLLIASFVLLALGGHRRQMEGSVKYVTLNLLSSALFLAGIGILYGLAGTLNMAQLAQEVAASEHTAAIHLSAVLFLAGFGIKSGIFPLFFWLPASYPTPPAAVSALFSGLLTKVGVYALVRVFTLIFIADVSFTHGWLIVLGIFTMIIGVFGAASQFEIRSILSFHIVSQIGYMILGLGLFSELALAGVLFFLVHNMIAKSNLFLISGVIGRLKGTTQLKELGGLYKEKPVLSVLFLLSAMALAGLPPLSGFFAKLLLVMAAIEAEAWVAGGLALFVGLLTLYSMTKIWSYGFWAAGSRESQQIPCLSSGQKWGMYTPIFFLSVGCLLLGLGYPYVMEYIEGAAAQLMHPQGYMDHVLGGK